MKKFTVIVVFAILCLAGVASAGPVELVMEQPNVSTWECMPVDVTLENSDWYAGISRSPGLNGSYWRTEGAITSVIPLSNSDDSLVSFNVYGPGVVQTIDVHVEPWTSVGALDVVEALSLPDGTYAINAVYPKNLSVTFRTYNDLGEDGTYGATLPKLSSFTKSFITWPYAVGRRWLYVVVLDNASFYVALYKYDGTLAYLEEVDASAFYHGYLYRRAVDPDIGFAVIEMKPQEGGVPGGHVYHPAVLPYGTGVDNLTGSPNIFTASPAIF